MRTIRVFLADDLPEMVPKVTQLLRNDFDIVGSAQDGQQALDSAADLNPDLVLLDISMPLLNGIEVASRLRERDCKAKIIFVTVHEDRDFVEAAFSVGAQGYVLKSHIGHDLVPAIREVMQGHRFVSSFQKAEP